MARKAQIRGIGGYVPDKVLLNADLAAIMDTSNEWIVSRSGIHQRHQAEDSVMASDLGVIAAQNALAHAGLDIADIDLIGDSDFDFDNLVDYVFVVVIYRDIGVEIFLDELVEVVLYFALRVNRRIVLDTF